MKYFIPSMLLLTGLFLKAQENYSANRLPVFKQVTHPFMPNITSEYFFFSEDGLLWFSTAQGLTSFDGSEVTYYSSLKQANSFELNKIAAMAEDRNHNFYIGTRVGLFYYNRKTRFYTRLSYTFRDNQQAPDIAFDVLYCDKDGLVYAGTEANGFFIYDTTHKQLHHINLDASRPDSWTDRRLNTVKSLAVHATDTNKLWIGSFHGIYLFDKKRKTFEQRFNVTNPGHYLQRGSIPAHYDIQKMDVADDSTIWFNCWTGGFGKYDTQTGNVKLFLHGARLKTPGRYISYVMPKFARLSPGKYLLGIYDYKTALFDCQKEDVQYFTVTNNDYAQEQTRFVTNDRQGNVWLLQRGQLYVDVSGNNQLRRVKLRNSDTISIPQLRGIYFDRSTNYFYAAFLYARGVYVFDTNFHLVKIIPVPVINNYYTYNTGIANKITKDSKGQFWTAGTENYILQSGSQQFLPVEKIFPLLAGIKTKDAFIDVITTKNGDLLYKDFDGVIYRIRYQSLKIDTISPPAIKSAGFQIKGSSQWYDAERNFIYLTSSNCIARYNLENNQTVIIPYKSLFGNLPGNSAACMSTLDEYGHIWFMIPQYGIRIINPETLYCEDSVEYGTKGLVRGDYTTITGATNKFMLLRSQNGVVAYDYSKQQSYLFNRDNGLSSPDNKSLLYSNGYMFIAESGEFEYFKLSDLKAYSSALKPRLNNILADTSLVYLNSGNDSATVTTLQYYQNSVSLSFSAQEFFFPERIEYAYQLTGVDNNWHFTNYFNRKIIYTKLAPGKYVFRLKAQMQGGNWNAKPVEYIIVITPAWWQTSWFGLLCIMAVASLFIYFIKKRIQIIRETEQKKSKHEKELLELEAKALRAQMNPHFIFNCMNSIKSLIQQKEEEKAVTYLTTFSKFLRTLLNNADKKEISLNDEMETCKLYLQLEAMRFDTGFSYNVTVDETMDLKSVQVPALIMQPFIENAIWHGIIPRGAGGHVAISLAQKGGQVEIVIDDNGIGREASMQNKPVSSLTHNSKGVNLSHARLALDNQLRRRQAKMETIDKKDERGASTGTMIIITINQETP